MFRVITCYFVLESDSHSTSSSNEAHEFNELITTISLEYLLISGAEVILLSITEVSFHVVTIVCVI